MKKIGIAMPNENLKCSFCGKRASEIAKLIAGPRIYICDQCVNSCIEILGSNREWVDDQIANLTRLRSQTE